MRLFLQLVSFLLGLKCIVQSEGYAVYFLSLFLYKCSKVRAADYIVSIQGKDGHTKRDTNQARYELRTDQPFMQGGIQVERSAGVHQTTIVINQPARHLKINPSRDWSSGICGCVEDVGSCLLVLLCGNFYGCYLSHAMNENVCLPLWHPLYLTSLRSKMRMQRDIQGSICIDHCSETWLPWCVMCQVKRELNAMRAEQGVSRENVL